MNAALTLFLSTFTTVFLAELGDKTQLATFSLAAGAKSRVPVFLGAWVALGATSLIAVLLGETLGRYVSPVWLRRGAGVLFVAMGIIFLVRPGE